MEKIIRLLKEKQITIATCESITGGMIASTLVDTPGASEVFLGGVVAYTNRIKTKLVGVSKDIINQYGAISPETAKAMALGTINKFNSDIAIAITGNAGPSLDENKPMGIAYLAICVIDKIYAFELKSYAQSRNEIRMDLTSQSLEHLYKILLKVGK